MNPYHDKNGRFAAGPESPAADLSYDQLVDIGRHASAPTPGKTKAQATEALHQIARRHGFEDAHALLRGLEAERDRQDALSLTVHQGGAEVMNYTARRGAADVAASRLRTRMKLVGLVSAGI